MAGPGGLIPPMPDNEELIETIERTPPLGREELLQFAKSYKQFPTNLTLGNHLALLAAVSSDGKIPQELFGEYAPQDSINEDLWEFWHIIDDSSNEDSESDDQQLFTLNLQIRKVTVFKIDLLVETVIFQSSPEAKNNTAHFIIGVAPGPALVPSSAPVPSSSR